MRNALRHNDERENPRMKYTPSECPKCGSPLVKNPKGGRPTRWCSEGCKRSGESEMSRLESLLRVFTEGKYVDRINGRPHTLRDEALADMQTCYDKLAGVPVQFIGCGQDFVSAWGGGAYVRPSSM